MISAIYLGLSLSLQEQILILLVNSSSHPHARVCYLGKISACICGLIFKYISLLATLSVLPQTVVPILSYTWDILCFSRLTYAEHLIRASYLLQLDHIMRRVT